MTAYMDLNGVPATGNRWLLDDVLRGELGFDGFLVSDANAVRSLVTHGFATDLADAGARAMRRRARPRDGRVRPRVRPPARRPSRAGLIDEAALDVCVRRVLAAKIRLGLFEDPYVHEGRAAEVLSDPAHRDVARLAAERTAVLLRNEGGLLPLDPATLGTVAVLGPLADSRRDTIGPWVFDYDNDETVTVLAGLRARLGSDAGGVQVDYAARCPTRAADLPVDVRHVGRQRPGRPGRLRRRGRAAGAPSTSPPAPRSRSSSSASGRT